MIPLSFEEAMAVARRIHSTPEAGLSRAVTGLSLNAIVSLVILAIQLDAIAQASAAYATGHPDLDRYAALQELLVAAGYLPLPATTATQEADRGQG